MAPEQLDQDSIVELRLLREVADIMQRISALQNEREALERVLVRVRARKIQKTDVTRKNSFKRIVVEDRVLEELAEATRPLSTDTLYRAAKEVVYGLKENTFRSCVHRMKDRGQITSPARGTWVMAPNKKTPSPP